MSEGDRQANVEAVLWHATWPENVASIQANGFRDGDVGWVWFGPRGDPSWALSGEVILEVVFDLAEEDLKPYRSVTNVEIQGDPCRIYPQTTYRIPADFVNAHRKGIREISPT